MACLAARYGPYPTAYDAAHQPFHCRLAGNSLHGRDGKAFALQRQIAGQPLLPALRGFGHTFFRGTGGHAAHGTQLGGLVTGQPGNRPFSTHPARHGTQPGTQCNLASIRPGVGLRLVGTGFGFG